MAHFGLVDFVVDFVACVYMCVHGGGAQVCADACGAQTEFESGIFLDPFSLYILR